MFDDAVMKCPSPTCEWTGGMSETVPEDLDAGGPGDAMADIFIDARFCPDCGTQVEFVSEPKP